MVDVGDYFDKNSLLITLNAQMRIDEFNMNLLKYYANIRDYGCVYVAVNKTYPALMSEFRKQGIKTGNVYIVDLVSRTTKLENSVLNADKNVVFVGGPSALTELSIAVTSLLESINKGRKIVLFESLSTLGLYNNQIRLAHFFHAFINLVRQKDAKIAIVSTSDNSNATVQQIMQFCDMHLEINDKYNMPWVH